MVGETLPHTINYRKMTTVNKSKAEREELAYLFHIHQSSRIYQLDEFDSKARLFLIETKSKLQLTYEYTGYPQQKSVAPVDLYTYRLSRKGKRSVRSAQSFFAQSLANTIKNIPPTEFEILSSLQSSHPGVISYYCRERNLIENEELSIKMHKEAVDEYEALSSCYSYDEMITLAGLRDYITFPIVRERILKCNY